MVLACDGALQYYHRIICVSQMAIKRGLWALADQPSVGGYIIARVVARSALKVCPRGPPQYGSHDIGRCQAKILRLGDLLFIFLILCRILISIE